MMNRAAFRRSRGLTVAIALILLTVSFLMAIAPSYAQEGSPTGVGSPDTIDSSDGIIPEATLASGPARRQRGVQPPFEGTGIVPEGITTTANEPEVAPVPPVDPVSPESVIGTDNRYQITSTTTYPYRAIALVTSNIGQCTGWLIGVDTVVTAGHCVHNGAWATNVRVYPGRNGTSSPYGSCGAVRLYSVTGWTQSRNRDYDYGAIKLNCTIGNTTGWFGFRWQSSSMNGQPTYLAGYPGDKTYGTLWRHDDQVRMSQTYRLYYSNDTYGGQSGSPVWNGLSGCSPCGIAIHAYGVDATGYNGGTRITQTVYNNLNTWKNAPR